MDGGAAYGREWHADLPAWCRRSLGAPPAQLLFKAGNLSSVLGVRLADGRAVVVKARPPTPRLEASVLVHRHLWAAGFPCPRPLAGPTPLASLAITAEAYLPGGTQLQLGPRAPERFASALADLVARAPEVASLPTLTPPPAWVWWDHDKGGPWPPSSEGKDLNATPGPPWLVELAWRVRRRILASRLPLLVGHLDWESQNLRWHGARLYAVHDWDSVAARPEAAIAGAAAVVFVASDAVGAAAPLGMTRRFLTAYERRRGRPWSTEEQQVCWAAGLWVLAYNAVQETLRGADGPHLARLAAEAEVRLRLAGA